MRREAQAAPAQGGQEHAPRVHRRRRQATARAATPTSPWRRSCRSLRCNREVSNFSFRPVNRFCYARHHSRAAASNGASVRKSGRRTPSARVSRVARTAPSRATFARHCRRSCRRRLPATPRPASTVAAACALGVLAGGGELQLEDPRQPAGRPATPRPTSTVAAACALGVLAGGGASCSWRIRGRGRPEAPPSRRRRRPPRWRGLSL